MIVDERTEFCDATACNTGAAGTYLLGDQIDLGSANNVGTIDGLYLVITVDTGITVATSTGTIQFKLASDASASIATDGSATEHYLTPAFATSTTAIAAGTVLAAVALPKGFTYERYLGILQVTGTTAVNAGKINAFLTTDVARWAAYDSPAQA
jgi:hypothetical protein